MGLRIRVRNLMVLIATIAGVLWFLDQGRAICDGGYQLGVRVNGPSVRTLYCVVCGNKFEADGMGKLWMKPIDADRLFERRYQEEPFTGKPFTVIVPTSGVRTGLGRSISDTQFSGLFIAVLYQDGSRGFKSIAIPQRSESRQIQVSFP